MKTSIVDVTVKVIVQHEDEQSPQDVIANCNYEFAIEPDEGKESPLILNTEIMDADTRGFCDPDTHALLPEQECEQCGGEAVLNYDEKHGKTILCSECGYVVALGVS